MGNAVIITALILSTVFAVRSCCKKLRQGCCGGGGDPQARSGIEGMNCRNCRNCGACMENALKRKNKCRGIQSRKSS